MKSFLNTNERGSLTIIVVFVTTMVLLLLAFSDHVAAMKEEVMTRNDIVSEQAFYAAQSCLEDGYLQLRTNAAYSGTNFTVGHSSCTVIPEQVGTSGRLVSVGTDQTAVRSIAAEYSDAGPAADRKHSAIFHLIDKSGSMNYRCTPTQYDTEAECIENNGSWGPPPIEPAREAAKGFVDRLDSNYDKIGVISYHEGVTVNQQLSVDYPTVKNAISAINPEAYYTNIGDPIEQAGQLLLAEPDPPDDTITRVEILLTDGRANWRPLPLPPTCSRPNDTCGEQYALTKAAAAKANGVLIFSIGLGGGVNPGFLRSVASTIDGVPMYFFAPQGDDLDAIYDRIADILISYNLSQSSWQEN
ncbi:MAG: VWA domain-containing protein [Patescibacteria group bacterium]|jgi:Tfp pilus assembly protein PilX